MSRPNRSNGGFSTHNQQSSKSFADHAAKEQQAVSLINQGKLQEAEAIYEDLIATGTRNHVVFANLAAVYLMQGSYTKSIPLLKKVIQLEPNDPDAHNNLGIALKELGDLDDAIASYNTALQLKPNYPDAHNNLGNALKQKGDLTAAVASYNTAIKLNPSDPDAHNNLSIALQEKGDLDAAIASYNTALQLKPNDPKTHNNLGIALQEKGHHNAAIASYNTALQLKPNDPKTHNNLGIALKEQGDLNAAIASYNNALQLKPNDPEIHFNLGIAFMGRDELELAISSYNKALRLKPIYTEAHNNLGIALHEKADLIAAIASYDKALGLKPNDPDAHWNSSAARLLGGNYKKGWEQYEWRAKKQNSNSKPHAQPKCCMWDGSKIDRNTDILLVSEQGLGDTLQFMRYAFALREQGASVSICAQAKLNSLIRESGIDPSPLTPQEANKVSNGKWIPLLSVPRHLGVNPENPIITRPYIKTTDEFIDKWKVILSTEHRPIVGINWQGNPKAEKAELRGRSLALEVFSPITDSSQISLLSLQKGFGSEQLETCSFKDRFVSCQDQVNDTWDFLETAAIIANCDLVITSDTSVAHLAGGMGKSTWLLLKKVPEWRWGLEGDTTFWYPSMRLFRQTERGNWVEVIERVAEALQDHFGDNLETTQSTPAPPITQEQVQGHTRYP